MSLSTHVLDTSRGRPAKGVSVRLEVRTDGDWEEIGTFETDDDGRVSDLAATLQEGVYCLTFDTGGYYEGRSIETFYPHAAIVFEVTEPEEHHHVPLLLNPWGYSTYRGS